MKIVGVETRDVYVTFDLSFKEIQHILNFLDRSSIDYDKEDDQELHESVKFVKEEMFPMLNKLEGNIKNDFGPNSP